jgi:hypothetical protein
MSDATSCYQRRPRSRIRSSVADAGRRWLFNQTSSSNGFGRRGLYRGDKSAREDDWRMDRRALATLLPDRRPTTCRVPFSSEVRQRRATRLARPSPRRRRLGQHGRMSRRNPRASLSSNVVTALRRISVAQQKRPSTFPSHFRRCSDRFRNSPHSCRCERHNAGRCRSCRR